MLVLLGIGLAVGVLAVLGLNAIGRTYAEVAGIWGDLKRDLNHMAYLMGGLHQEVVGRLDDAKSENEFQYSYLSQAISDTAFVTTRLEKYRPLDSENELHDLVIVGSIVGSDANLQ